MSVDLGAPNATAVLGAAAHPIVRPPEQHPAPFRHSDTPLLVGVILIVVVGALKIVLRRRIAPRHAVSLDLVIVTIGFVLILMMRLPIGRHPGWFGGALFLAMPIFYRLLGSFEEPND